MKKPKKFAVTDAAATAIVFRKKIFINVNATKDEMETTVPLQMKQNGHVNKKLRISVEARGFVGWIVGSLLKRLCMRKRLVRGIRLWTFFMAKCMFLVLFC